MWATARNRGAWAIEVIALGGGAALSARGLATIHTKADARQVVVVTLALVALSATIRLAERAAPSGLGVVLLAVLAPGLLRADDPFVTVLGFAAGALVPVAVLLGGRTFGVPKLIGAVVAATAVFAVVARALFRYPFRELRCEPACVVNEYLVTRSPGLVLTAERLAAAALLVWCAAAAPVLRRAEEPLGRRVNALLVAAAAAWAVALLRQPRPLPGDRGDAAWFLAPVTMVAAAAALHAVASWRVVAARLRIARIGRSLSAAGDVEEIAAWIRRAVRDPRIDVMLGDDRGGSGEGSATTAVVRGGRVVATVVHRTGQHQRIAGAVTPAVALALETQLVLAEARDQLRELEVARRDAVHAQDEARRRLERDLHDGAQQRLLVVGMRLAHEAGRAQPGIGRWLGASAAVVGEALTELRRIGRGDAAVIAELGLDDAVTSLVGTSDLQVEVTSRRCDADRHECWPATASTTAYRLVIGTLGEAERGGATAVTVELRCLGETQGRAVTTRHDGTATGDRGADHDRVYASGGSVVRDERGTAPVFEARLP